MKTPDKPYVIVDIDGVLADNTHRLRWILTPDVPKDWDEYDARAPYDTLHQGVAEIVYLLWQRGYRIVIMTGRNERTRQQTELWLDHHDIPWAEVHMRDYTDRRPAVEVKMECIDAHEFTPQNTLCIFEDEPSTVQTMREEGFLVFDPQGWQDYNDILHTGGRDDDD